MNTKGAKEIIIPFGKYKGMTLDIVAAKYPSYLNWLIKQEGFDPYWKKAAKLALAGESIPDNNVSLSIPLPKTVVSGKIHLSAQKKSFLGIEFPYEDSGLRETIKYEIDGRKFEKTSEGKGIWLFPEVQILKVLDLLKGRTFTVDDKVQRIIDREDARKKDLETLRTAEDIEIDIPTLIPLYGFQKTGVVFVERAGGRALIADQMGVGKTATAIGYSIRHNLKTLVVCPKSVVYTWEKQLAKFYGKSYTLWNSKGKVGRIDAKFHIASYETATKHFAAMNAAGFDLLIADEATYLKNRKTLRAKAIMGSYKERKKYPGIKTKHVIFLTGTPILNRPVEAYYLLNFLDNKRFNNFYNFVERYGGWMGEPAKNLNELHERTKELIIRRRKQDVLKDLPEKLPREDIIIDLSDKERKEYDTYLQDVLNKWNSTGKPTVAELPAIQKFLFEKKLPRLKEILDETLESGDGVLVFSVYLDPLRKIHELYPNDSLILEGQMNKTEREQTIKLLSEGKKKIGLFSLGAGAMGIDGLQDSISATIFLNRWFVPAVHEQAEDRIHRNGQQNKVSTYYMTCAGTIDEHMKDLLTEKLEVIEQAIDGEIITANAARSSFFREFVKRLRKDSPKLKLIKDENIDEVPDLTE